MKKVNEEIIRKELQKYNVDGWTLFQEVDEQEKLRIIGEVFKKHTNYQLIPQRGLVEMKQKNPDQFHGYKDFSHVYSVSMLVFDMNQTIKHSQDSFGRMKRRRAMKKREAYYIKKGKELVAINRQQHLIKWEVQDLHSKKKWKALQDRKKSLGRDTGYER